MMVKAFLCCALVLGLTAAASATEIVQLPEPQKTGGAALLDCLASRHATREFADVELTDQQLSDLLWAAGGVNRADGRFVYPTAMNVQDMLIYVVSRAGAFRYDPQGNALVQVASGDSRATAGMQPFVASAAVNLVYVQDTARWKTLKFEAPAEKVFGFGCVHAGEIAQNVGLYAASQGWANVVRGSYPEAELAKLLGLSEGERILLTQSVGPEA